MSHSTNSSLSPDAPRPAASTTRRAKFHFARLGPKAETVAALIAIAVALLVAGGAIAEGYHSNPWLLTWIPAPCCVTNDCCWQITESEVRPASGDQWEILATGQIQPRTGWSPDGKFYRCACDFAEGHWVKHQGAHTRCLFVPLRSASR